MSSLLTPFKAYVDQSLISNASNFFDNSTTSILRELLQNSRRSGATRVDLRQSGRRWKYSDNGPGCAPQDLLGLGASRWAEGVREAETPAGCGFFSLARRNPTVSCPSHNWRMDLNEGHFNGELEIQPEIYGEQSAEEVAIAPGLVIEFDSTGSEYGLQTIAKYMPIDFYVNGSRQDCQHDFLAKPPGSVAHKIIEVSEHITVRVDLLKGTTGAIAACYHGWKVDFPDRDYFTVGTTGDNFTTQVAVLVTREKALPLELPQRNKMVVSDATKAIKELIHCTSLELAAANLKYVSLASPSIWLNARARGYTGEVLYPKFFGQLVTRSGEAEMQDYSLPDDDDDGYIYDLTRFITIDEFEEGDYKCKPGKDLLALIAQTSIPFVKNDAGSLYDLDLDEYFAPGLRLVKPLESCSSFGHSIQEGGEGYEWAQRLIHLRKRGHAWYDEALVVAKGVTEDGKEFGFEEEALGLRSFDEDNVYDSIQLEFRADGDDANPIILPTAALFGLDGDKDDSDIEFIVTKGWFDGMPAAMPDSLARFAYGIRKCRETDCEDEVTVDKMAEKLREKFAKFAGLEDFYKQRFIDAAIAGVDGGLYSLDQKPGCVVLTLPVASGGRYVSTGLATCEFIPPFEAHYRFEGSHGITHCDAQGNRNPFEADVPGTNKPPYPEYHSFDVPTMERLGIKPGSVDILDACGWYDSTKKIYVTPELAHVMWTVGCLAGDPSLAADSPEVRAALISAFKEERISSDLYSAMWYEYNAVVKSLVGDAMSYLPPIRKLWFYSSVI